MDLLPRWVLALATLIISGTFGHAEIRVPLELPPFDRRSLLNGMEILFLPGGQEPVPFLLMIKNGAAFDPVEKWGVTHLMARMMLEQTETHNGDQLREDLRKLNAEINVRVTWDAVFFSGSTPSAQLGPVLSLLSDVVIRPVFDEETFERVRKEVLQEIETGRRGDEASTEQIFRTVLFGENPYSHSVRGEPDTLKNLDLPDIKFQYRRLIVPNQSQLAIYYSGDMEEMLRGLGRRWGVWVKKQPAPFTFRPANPPDERHVILVEGQPEQSLFRWGRVTVDKSSRDYYELKVLEQYFILSLPVWAENVAGSQQVRGSAQLEARRMPGFLQISIQAPADRLPAYLDELFATFRQLHSGQLDPRRFEEARRLVYLEFRSALEDPFGRLLKLVEADLYNLGINYIPTFTIRLNRVTPESFQKVLREQLSTDSFVLVVSGPLSELRSKLESLGRVTILN